MRFQIGPLPSGSVRAWIGHAKDKIDEIQSGPFETRISQDVLAAFQGYLTEWERAAVVEEFLWEEEVPGEIAEYHAHAFHQIADRMAEAAEARGESLQPPDGEAFYQALVMAIIDGLQMEDQTTAAYADHLRSFWPGFADGEAATTREDS